MTVILFPFIHKTACVTFGGHLKSPPVTQAFYLSQFCIYVNFDMFAKRFMPTKWLRRYAALEISEASRNYEISEKICSVGLENCCISEITRAELLVGIRKINR